MRSSADPVWGMPQSWFKFRTAAREPSRLSFLKVGEQQYGE